MDRRRDTLLATRATQTASDAEVARLDTELDANANRVSQMEGELANARDRVAALKKSIKAARKYRVKLRAGRKRARQNTAKAQQRAAEAERRYDKAMLADMLAREKQQHLAQLTTTTGPPPSSGGHHTTRRTPTGCHTTRRPPTDSGNDSGGHGETGHRRGSATHTGYHAPHHGNPRLRTPITRWTVPDTPGHASQRPQGHHRRRHHPGAADITHQRAGTSSPLNQPDQPTRDLTRRPGHQVAADRRGL